MKTKKLKSLEDFFSIPPPVPPNWIEPPNSPSWKLGVTYTVIAEIQGFKRISRVNKDAIAEQFEAIKLGYAHWHGVI